MSTSTNDFFKSKVLGHPAGLFVLFFTEMWERFSYYGMRALLVLFLVSSFGLGGWDWPREHALALYGTYTALVYITPILGGFIADKYIGYRMAVVIGATIMTLGHASMAIESSHIFLYIGIGMLIIGNGFFKPNITSIISHMYKNHADKKDGAYTIFYMGVNAGAFLGILLCGYIGENVGWNYGFGLAGIFMFLGMLQFFFAQKIFGDIGLKPEKKENEKEEDVLAFEGDYLNPFTSLDKILIAISAIIGVVWVINDPMSKIADKNILMFNEIDYSNHFILIGLFTFLFLIISRILRYPKITRDRMIAIVFFAVMTVIFWMSFEQAGGSMTIFAKDYTNRIMTGNYYYIYLIVNILITIIPVGIITWVLMKLFQQTFKNYKVANLILGFSFLIIWGIIFWSINRDLNSSSYIASYKAVKTQLVPEQYNQPDRLATYKSMLVGDSKFTSDKGDGIAIASISFNNTKIKHEHSKLVRKSEREAEQKTFDDAFVTKVLAIQNTGAATVHYEVKGKEFTVPLNKLSFETTITKETLVSDIENKIAKTTTIIEPLTFSLNDNVSILDVDKKGKFIYINNEKVTSIESKAKEFSKKSNIVRATITKIKNNEVEIPATWFLILNSLFIIAFAPLFSKWWESKYNPSASTKYGLGLILLGVGFGALAIGSLSIESGAKSASISMVWLVLAYFFHTIGELCLSPVSLSYISKLVPGRMIALMFGVWYIAIAIGNKLAGLLGGSIDKITEQYDMTTFFLIFTAIPVILGIIGVAMSPIVKKLMHGVK